MKLAVMQPYLFPYLGYFQLIHAVDTFVFYDDVNFIKRGWINRNKILVNGSEYLFTVPLSKVSQNKLINEISINQNENWKSIFLKTIEQNYSKAPYFENVFSLLKELLIEDKNELISDLNITAIEKICDFLDLKTKFEISSKNYSESRGIGRQDRIIAIAKKSRANKFINPIAGKNLYSKEYFYQNGIELNYLENKLKLYDQFKNNFVSGLSILDALMFNSKKEMLSLLTNYNVSCYG